MELRWILFDLNGTLLDPATMARPLGDDEASRQLARDALQDAVSQSMVDTLTGEFAPFPDYLGAALRRLLTVRRGSDEGCDEALELASRLDPFPQAAVAIERLRAAGLEVGVLTNSATDSATAAIEHAGLDELLSPVIGCDQVQRYKPDVRVYRHGVSELGVQPQAVCLVAAHWWDCLGARRAGLRSAWAGHQERELLASARPLDATGDDLAQVAERIVALRDGG